MGGCLGLSQLKGSERQEKIISITQIEPTAATLGPIRQTYSGNADFPPMAKAYKQVSQVVKETGLLGRTQWFYVLVSVGIAVALGGLITGFILLGDSWFQLLIAAGLGIVLTQIAFLGHEAAHRQILTTGPANFKLARIVIASIGMSYSWWDSKHTKHHGNPNQVGKDPDIEVDTISFLEEDAAKAKGLIKLITRKQGWLFFPLLTLEGLNLHFLGLKYLLTTKNVKGRWTELSIIALRFALILVPVFMMLPLGMAFAFMGVQFAVFGVYMGAAFAPNHKGMPIVDPAARLDFFTKQVRTSRNISGGWWTTWLMGGLNYQVEHHLFPSMPRPHLAKAREIVRDYCAANNVPYTETSLGRSYLIVIEYLNRVGLAAGADPFDCPAVAQFGRA
ncbi:MULTISPECIES: fatty acid desaturase family protein [Microbacterium]|uniref:Acyl-CoA desaturase n=1 Tax=Microbacterium aurugineum TaxID=2851642 RepID=A0ABY4J1I6_9MICO|nr:MULTISPECIES: acyl-CoA desaturase [Microbacterium]MCK8467165.1 acyl-CoA desaturase [Microbacterium aurugineum]UPL18824.1 acyl-CoA desaturase [Microbacterium aurugineum]UUE21183.1 acyl-CoA desaturase [Microbacterium sp. J1-1]